MAYYSQYRFRKLGLERLIDFLYSPPDHDLPDGQLREDIRFYDPAHYALERTEHRFTPPGELKPNPEILRSILRSLNVSAEQAISVGDSPHKSEEHASDLQSTMSSLYAVFGLKKTKKHKTDTPP